MYESKYIINPTTLFLFLLPWLATSHVPPTPPTRSSVLHSIQSATAAALQNQYPSGQAKCDYHLLHGHWYDYEQIWHTGQLASGLMAAHKVLPTSFLNSSRTPSLTKAAILAGEWWISQASTSPPTFGLIQSIDTIEQGHGCITDACGPTEDLTDITDGSHSMFQLSALTMDPKYANAASVSASWQLNHMQTSTPGLYWNVINTSTGQVIPSSGTRSNIEGSIFLDACLHTKNHSFCAAFLDQADYTVAQQNNGVWMQWPPNDNTTGRFHPRFNTWYALALLDAANHTAATDVKRSDVYVAAAMKTAKVMQAAQQHSGTIYYWNTFNSTNSSIVIPEKNAVCGSAVSVALQLWLRLFQLGYHDFDRNIVASVQWLIMNQYTSTHPDVNLAGSFLELGFRKLVHWTNGAAVHELDVVQRDLATNTGLQGMSEYLDMCQNRQTKGWEVLCSATGNAIHS